MRATAKWKCEVGEKIQHLYKEWCIRKWKYWLSTEKDNLDMVIAERMIRMYSCNDEQKLINRRLKNKFSYQILIAPENSQAKNFDFDKNTSENMFLYPYVSYMAK